jgi:hypothetical protein
MRVGVGLAIGHWHVSKATALPGHVLGTPPVYPCHPARSGEPYPRWRKPSGPSICSRCFCAPMILTAVDDHPGRLNRAVAPGHLKMPQQIGFRRGVRVLFLGMRWASGGLSGANPLRSPGPHHRRLSAARRAGGVTGLAARMRPAGCHSPRAVVRIRADGSGIEDGRPTHQRAGSASCTASQADSRSLIQLGQAGSLSAAHPPSLSHLASSSATTLPSAWSTR